MNLKPFVMTCFAWLSLGTASASAECVKDEIKWVTNDPGVIEMYSGRVYRVTDGDAHKWWSTLADVQVCGDIELIRGNIRVPGNEYMPEHIEPTFKHAFVGRMTNLKDGTSVSVAAPVAAE